MTPSCCHLHKAVERSSSNERLKSIRQCTNTSHVVGACAKPTGVLARVASLFARRGYNIFSLAVAPTEQDEYSRITIVVDVESAPLEQIVKQLFKLIDVVRISELDPRKSVERELMVATIKASASERGEIVELVNIFEGRILSVGADAIIVSLDGSPEKLDDFTELLRQYGITESQRTGRVALPKLDPANKATKALNSQGKAN